MSLIKSVNSASAADASISCSATGILQNSKEWECTKGENCFSFDQHPLQHRGLQREAKSSVPYDMPRSAVLQRVSELDGALESCQEHLHKFL